MRMIVVDDGASVVACFGSNVCRLGAQTLQQRPQQQPMIAVPPAIVASAVEVGPIVPTILVAVPMSTTMALLAVFGHLYSTGH